MSELILTKSSDWAYEDEYRIIYDLNEVAKTNSDKNLLYLKDIHPKQIKRVLFGVSCPEDFVKSIRKELEKSELSHVKAEQVYLDHYHFKLRLESEFTTEEDRLFIALK